MATETKKPLTWRELRDALSNCTNEQLDATVKWWGEERGGVVKKLDVLSEEWITLDDRDGYQPRSDFAGQDLDEDEIDGRMPAGTMLLAVD